MIDQQMLDHWNKMAGLARNGYIAPTYMAEFSFLHNLSHEGAMQAFASYCQARAWLESTEHFATFVGLYTNDTLPQRIPAFIVLPKIKGTHNHVRRIWVIDDENIMKLYNRKFIPVSGVKTPKRVQTKLNLIERLERAPAKVRFDCIRCFGVWNPVISIHRNGDESGRNATLIP